MTTKTKRKGRCAWYYGKEGTPDFDKCPYCQERLWCPAARLRNKKPFGLKEPKLPKNWGKLKVNGEYI
jgi:hypothetical protein